MRRRLALCFSALAFTSHCIAQDGSFEVVSIKPNNSGAPNSGMGPQGSRFVATNVTLRTLIMYAYSRQNGRLMDSQIVGEPAWARSDRFDLEAKLPDDARVLPGERTRSMLRSLLADSFNLKVHKENRDLPVYNMVATRRGPRAAENQTPIDPHAAIVTVATEGGPMGALARGTVRMVMGHHTTTLEGTGISVGRLVEILQPRSDRIIVDRAAFTQLLDVQVSYETAAGGVSLDPPAQGGTEPDPAETAPSLFTALQEIGLKLEPGKAPAEVLVIDSVTRPRQN